ncbi:MAG: TIGR03000 domain-containing protein [Fimbriiglobus sp.]
MAGREFFRRGLILAITTATSLSAIASDPRRVRPDTTPGVPAWNYHNVPNGPQVVPGVGHGAYVGPGAFRSGWVPGVGFGPAWGWGQQSVIGSTWTNGLSLYGPPIPTYAPVPGSFGNADMSRLFSHQPPPPGFGFGYGVGLSVGGRGSAGSSFAPVMGPGSLGWGSRYSPSPRPLPNVSVYPQAPQQPMSVIAAPSAEVGQCIRVMVTMPDANADLWVEKQIISAKGIERVFESPELQPGQRYTYQIMARWTANGREQAESRTVTATAGQLVRVNFLIPAE